MPMYVKVEFGWLWWHVPVGFGERGRSGRITSSRPDWAKEIGGGAGVGDASL